MNWKEQLFKPKWQHKDAAIRLTAVVTEQDPQLINSLVDIAANDDDARVRCAAVKRLHRLENILKLYGKETDPGVKTLLEERIRQLTATSDASRPALELRLQVVNSTADKKLLEHLAGHGPEAEIRRAALARVERQGLLGDCCIEDSDAENRRFAAGRITQHTTLKRVIKGLRKRDKTLYTQLQERLHRELLDKADPGAVHSEALSICTALEQLAIAAGDPQTQAKDALHTAWQRIAGMVQPDMAERYQRVCERLKAPPATSPAEEPAKPASKPAPKQTAEPLQDTPPQPAATPQASEDPDQAARQKQQAALKQQREQQREQRERDLGKAEVLLAQLGQELEQGELHKALASRAKIQKLGKGYGKHRGWQRLNREMAGMQARLRELREWHHWSNNKIRKRLIAEMEVLPAADLHPDALLDRVKSLQVEWKTLEQSEQIPGDKHFAAAPWMWRKFSAAGHRAFDTAKPYLEKRSEIQSRHAETLASFCTQLEQLADQSPPDWTALGKALSRGRKKLRGLDSIQANKRQAFARQLKAALDKANNAMQDHYQEVEKEKMKLIRAASQLIHLPERSEAIAQAKSLQAGWKAAGSLWRSKEQTLWDQFREHLDPLFEELKEQQETKRAADKEKLARQKALCDELAAILESAEDLSARHGVVQGLRDAWKDIERPDGKLLTSFQALVADYRQRVKQAEQLKVNADRERWWLKSSLLHELTVTGRTATGAVSKKTQAKVAKTWPQSSSDDALEIALDRACKNILAGKAAEAEGDDAGDLAAVARLLCIRLEFVAGLQSPEEDRDQRMQYQVERLAESMSGESARQPAIDQAREAEKTWLAMYTLPEPEYKSFGHRVKQALAAILEVY